MSTIRVDSPHESKARVGNRPVVMRADEIYSDLTPEHKPRSESAPLPLVSVIIPAKNEAASLPTLLEELAHTLSTFSPWKAVDDTEQSITFEVIVIDDGSTDGTRDVLTVLATAHPSLRPLFLRRSIGQSSCLIAGIRQARGLWIATLDGDLQNHPADLEILWRALPGHHAALGWRVRRADRLSKRLTSWAANHVRNVVLGQGIRDTGCALRIFPRSFGLRLPAFDGVHRFIGPLLLREGCHVVQVPVSHRPRVHGQSHYNFWNRSWHVLVDLLGVAWLMRRPVSYSDQERHLPQFSSNSAGIARPAEGWEKPSAEQVHQAAHWELAETCPE
jgi:glycosyltransferase involved in cell wall biosynthesis